MAEDNVSWQVCVDQALHGQNPSLPFLYATCPPQASHPAPASSSGSFREFVAVASASIVSAFFCEVRMGLWALCLVLSYLQNGFACARGEPRQREEVQVVNGSTTDR